MIKFAKGEGITLTTPRTMGEVTIGVLQRMGINQMLELGIIEYKYAEPTDIVDHYIFIYLWTNFGDAVMRHLKIRG
jgi:hypothetical protein